MVAHCARARLRPWLRPSSLSFSRKSRSAFSALSDSHFADQVVRLDKVKVQPLELSRQAAQRQPLPFRLARLARAKLRISRRKVALNWKSVMRARIASAEVGQFLALQRLQPDNHDVRRTASVYQGIDRRIAAVSAVPVGLAVDLDGVIERWQAGRSEQRIDRQLPVLEQLEGAGSQPGGGDEQPDCAPRAQRFEIDPVRNDLPQRIDVEGIELIRREQAGPGRSAIGAGWAGSCRNYRWPSRIRSRPFGRPPGRRRPSLKPVQRHSWRRRWFR